MKGARGAGARLKAVKVQKQKKKPKFKFEEDDEDENGEFGESHLKRSVFTWVKSREVGKIGPDGTATPGDWGKPREHEVITPNELVISFGVPRYIVLNYVQNEVMKSNACWTLPFTLLLVVAYSVMVVQHMNAPVIRGIEESITATIEMDSEWSLYQDAGHKGMFDVNNFDEMWAFAYQGLFPNIFNQEYAFSGVLEDYNGTEENLTVHGGELPFNQWGILFLYNRVMGGVRFRQERVDVETCAKAPDLTDFHDSECAVSDSRKFPLQPELENGRITIPDKSKTVWFWTSEPYPDNEARLMDLVEGDWVDDRTAKVEIFIPIYNGEYGVHTLISLNFFFSRGGRVWKQMIAQSCYASWYTKWYHYTFDAIYVLCILWILVSEVIEIYQVLMRFGCKGILKDYLDLYNLIDWISVVAGGLVLYSWFHVQLQTVELRNLSAKLGEQMRGSDEEHEAARKYLDHLETTVWNVTMLSRGLAMYPLVVAFRLLRSFHAQPRLALVTMTINNAIIDLFHFMIVFFFVFLCCVTSGVVLFGRDIEELSTFPRGCMFVGRMLLGDFEFDAMKENNRLVSIVWFTIVVVVLGLILLNMLLAIVLDSYSVIKAAMGRTESLVAEFIRLFQRWRATKRKKTVPLEIVASALDHVETPDDRRRNPEESEDLDGSLVVTAMPPPEQQEPVESDNLGEVQNSVALCSMATSDSSKASKKVRPTFSLESQQNVRMRDALKETDLISLVARPSSRHNKKYVMPVEQARSILEEAVQDYYRKHKENAASFEYMRLAHKIVGRIKKIRAAHPEGARRKREKNMEKASGAMNGLRLEVSSMLEGVQADRLKASSELERLRAEVAELQEQLRQEPALPAGTSFTSAQQGPWRAASISAAPAAGVGMEAPIRSTSKLTEIGSRLAPLTEEPPGVDAHEQPEEQPARNDSDYVLRATPEEQPGGNDSDLVLRAMPEEPPRAKQNHARRPLPDDGPDPQVDVSQPDPGEGADLRGVARTPPNEQRAEVGPIGAEVESVLQRVERAREQQDWGANGDWTDNLSLPGSAASARRAGSNGASQEGSIGTPSDLSELNLDDDELIIGDDFVVSDDEPVSLERGGQLLNQGGPRGANTSRVADGVGFLRAEGPRASPRGTQREFEFTTFRDAQSQLRGMLQAQGSR